VRYGINPIVPSADARLKGLQVSLIRPSAPSSSWKFDAFGRSGGIVESTSDITVIAKGGLGTPTIFGRYVRGALPHFIHKDSRLLSRASQDLGMLFGNSDDNLYSEGLPTSYRRR
jgi:hypothetical protein